MLPSFSTRFFVWFSVLCGMVVMQAHFSKPSAEALTRKARAPLTGKTHSDQELNQKWLNFLNKFKKLKKIDLQQGMVTDAKKHHINKMAHFLTTHLKKQLKPNDKLKLKVVENEMGHKISYLLKKYFEKKLIPKAERAMRAARVARGTYLTSCQLSSDTCMHGGTCIDGQNPDEFRCECPPGFYGGFCHRKIKKNAARAPCWDQWNTCQSKKHQCQFSSDVQKLCPRTCNLCSKGKPTARRGGWIKNYLKSSKSKLKNMFGKSHRRPGSAKRHHGGYFKKAHGRRGGWPHPLSSKRVKRGWFNGIEAKIKKAFKQKGGGSHRRPGSTTKHHGRSSKVANQRSGGWGKTFNPHPASSKGANRGWLKKILSHHPKASSKRVKRSWFQREKSKWHTKKPQQGGGSKGKPAARQGGWSKNYLKSYNKKMRKLFGMPHRRPGSATKHHGRSHKKPSWWSRTSKKLHQGGGSKERVERSSENTKSVKDEVQSP